MNETSCNKRVELSESEKIHLRKLFMDVTIRDVTNQIGITKEKATQIRRYRGNGEVIRTTFQNYKKLKALLDGEVSLFRTRPVSRGTKRGRPRKPFKAFLYRDDEKPAMVIKSASEAVKMRHYPREIKSAIKKGKTYHGYYWKQED